MHRKKANIGVSKETPTKALNEVWCEFELRKSSRMVRSNYYIYFIQKKKAIFNNIHTNERDAEYIDYALLKTMIKQTADDALGLAKAYDAVLRYTGVVIENDINLLQLSGESKFFERLENEVSKAEQFYRDRLIEMVENFYLLVQSAIEQSLIESFK